jgi:soluble lytic murein transglycosylase-like protein
LTRARIAVAVLALAWAAAPARAEIVVLANGELLKAASHRVDGDTVLVALRGGGEIGTPASSVRGYVPDEVAEELAAVTLTASPGDLHALAAAAARRHGLAPELVAAVAAVESGFNPAAVSPKGAQGLMQLMPKTAAALGVADAFDPAANLDGGSRHLRALIARYNGDLEKALAAYNAGEGAVQRHGGVPPYRETREYVKKVMSRYHGAEHTDTNN